MSKSLWRAEQDARYASRQRIEDAIALDRKGRARRAAARKRRDAQRDRDEGTAPF